MIEYPKIETLYERDPTTHKVKPGVFKNRTYALLKRWHFTEKIDGTNVRVGWEYGNLTFGGRTANAQMHPELLKHLVDTVLLERFQEIFPDVSVTIFGEGFGAGIQKGGGYSPTKRFSVFDVLVDDKWWLSWKNVINVCLKLGLDVVPSKGFFTLEEATEFVRVGFTSGLSSTFAAEGLVGRPEETLFDKKGHRLIVKLKTKDF